MVALLSGFLLGMDLFPHLWVVAGFLGLVIVVWISAIASVKTAILCLIGSVVFQNYLTPNLAFWVTPVYVLSAIVLLRLMLEGRYERVRAPMDGAVRAWILLAVLSIPVAFYFGSVLPRVGTGLRYSSLRPVLQFVALLLSVLPYFVLVSPLSRDRDLYYRGVRLFVATGTAVSLLALYDQAAYYAGLPRLDALAGPRPDVPLFSVAGTGLIRSRGTFLEPAQLGGFLVLTIALTMSLLLAGRQRRDDGSGDRSLWIALGVQTCALVATFSSGAYLGFVVACLALLLLARPRLRAVLVLVITAVAILVGVTALARLTLGGDPLAILTSRPLAALEFEESVSKSSFTPDYEYSRTPYRRASLELLRRYPLTGVGIGNFGYGAVMVDSRLRADAGSYGVLWGLLGEYGLPGAILLAYVAYACLSPVLSAYRRFGTAELAGFAAGFAGFLAQSLVGGYSRLEPTIWVFVSLAMAALFHTWQGSSASITRGRKTQSSSRP
jgi:hypothetical protein